MITQTRNGVLLDDGSYYVVLSSHQAEVSAAGFLVRRCCVGHNTPNGHECLGAFTNSLGGWTARISAAFDPETHRDFHEVATGVVRMDAIVALWQSRGRACR